jgi:hypothetical protein
MVVIPEPPYFIGALTDIAMLPTCTSGADALIRIRAALLCDGDRASKLILIASIALQGAIAEERDLPPDPKIIPLRTTPRPRLLEKD